MSQVMFLLRNKIVVQPPLTYGFFTRRPGATETYEAPPLRAGRATRGEPARVTGRFAAMCQGDPSLFALCSLW
jgi:hypothetical protein